MTAFARRHPIWTVVLLLAAAVLLWMIFAVWPKWLVLLIGKKKVFLNALFNGITLGGLYFLVASGFTLIFGLMRNVNLAHGSLYLLGGYIGYEFAETDGVLAAGLPGGVHHRGRPLASCCNCSSSEGWRVEDLQADAGDHRHLDRRWRT